jgi:hypothetical protein
MAGGRGRTLFDTDPDERPESSMPTQIRFAAHQIADLAAIRDVPRDDLVRAIENIEKVVPRPMLPAKLLAALQEQLPEHPQAAEPLLRQSLAITGFIRQAGHEIDDALAGIRAGLQRDASWSADEFERWIKFEPVFETLLRSPTILLVSKAIDLSFDFANVYRRGRIITDIRPLFGEGASNIEGAVVTFTLRLHFENVDGEHGFSIAMDSEDVRRLRDQCTRALEKACAAQALMTSARIPTITTGADHDD